MFAPHPVFRRCLVALALCLASAVPLRAGSADVDTILLANGITYLQVSPTDVFFEPNPFVLASIAIATAPDSIIDGSFSLLGNEPISLTKTARDTLLFVQRFATVDEASATFPLGTYFFSLDTATSPSPFTATLDLGNNFPSIYPQLTNTEWYSVVVQFDTREDFTFTWNSFPDFSSDPDHPSFVQFQLADVFNNTLDTETFNVPTDGITYSANSITPGIYIGRVIFSNADMTQSDNTSLLSTSLRMTEFIISAVDGPPQVTSPTEITVNQGALFVYTIDATNIPAQLDDASNLPPGVDFDSTGIIAGYPTTAGVYSVELSGSNSIASTTATLTINVIAPQALTITSSTRAAGSTGDPFRFQVVAPGASSAARLSATGLPPGLNVDPISGTITGIPTQSGDFTVQLTVTDGTTTADGQLLITLSDDPAFPGIRNPTTATLTPGQDFTYKINAKPETVGSSDSFGTNAADAATYQLIGDLPTGLTFDPKTGTISGKYQGSPQRIDGGGSASRLSGGAIVGNVQLFATNSRGTSTVPLVFFNSPVGAVNISTRLAIAGGDNVLIGGFIVTGNAPKKLIVRALGPSLPVAGALQDPVLEIHGSDGSLLTNDSWKSDDAQSITDSGIAPTDDREATIIAPFQPNVNYTAIVRGKDDSSGVALVELYDLGTAALDSSSNAKLANISTRGLVQTGDNVMIGGFIISQVQSKVIARAIGPSLAQAGVSNALADTTLELHGPDGQVVAANDDWESDQAQQIRDTGVPPTDPHESAVVATLNPGNYTAVVRGKNNATGVGLVEVYALQ